MMRHKSRIIYDYIHRLYDRYSVSSKIESNLQEKILYIYKYRVELKKFTKFIGLYSKAMVSENFEATISKYKRKIGNQYKMEKIKPIKSMDDILENIASLTEVYLSGELGSDETLDVLTKIRVLTRLLNNFVKKYDSDTKRLIAISEMGKAINERDLMLLESAVISGNEEFINDFLNGNKNKDLKEISDEFGKNLLVE